MKKHKKKRIGNLNRHVNNKVEKTSEELEEKVFVINNESSDEEIQAFMETRRKAKEEEEQKQREAEKLAMELKRKQEEAEKRIQMENAKKRLEQQRVREEEDKKISDQESVVRRFSISNDSTDEEIQAFMEAKHRLNEIKEEISKERLKREEQQKLDMQEDYVKLAQKIVEDEEDMDKEDFSAELSDKKKKNILVYAFLLLVFASFGVSYWKKNIAQNESVIKEKTEKYIKENLVQPGTDLKIAEFAKEGDLYKFTVEVGGQKIVSYLTGDGKKLLLNPIDLDGKSDASSSQAQAQAPAAEASTKKDVPEVELFVMSYCPYGVQAEKGILPVVEKLKSKINFSIKFVDYTLHGKKEFDENLNQYCIQKEEPGKFNEYLKCFAKEGDSEKCLASASIDKFKNSSCISVADKQFKLTENFSANAQSSPFNIHKDLNEKYGIQGSPSLVVNGQLLESGRDSASLLKTICSGFSNQPEECKEQLSSTNPAPGFGN